MNNKKELALQSVQSYIVEIRGVQVILDADIATLYGVETKRINEVVKNSPDKFPPDYMFEITEDELNFLRSDFSTAKISTKSRYLPKAFTEKGLYMLATILRSKKSVEVTFVIIETFVKVRNIKRELIGLHREADKDKQNEKMNRLGELLSDIVMPDLETSETESVLELNFVIGKIKHTIKRIKSNIKEK